MSRWQEKAHFVEVKETETKDATSKKDEKTLRETRELTTAMKAVADPKPTRRQRESKAAHQVIEEKKTPSSEPTQSEQEERQTMSPTEQASTSVRQRDRVAQVNHHNG
jgi:hypothetical protein